MTLPIYPEPNLSLEDQARSVLHILLDQAVLPATCETFPADPRSCPNCGTPTDSLSTPYCSENCKSQAAFVRQFRAALASEAILLPDKQTAFGERLWWLLGGGLPMREGRIPESAKRQVMKRCGGVCEFCGAPMSTIQNFGSGCNRPLHLRAVCDDCSKTKSFCDQDFTQFPEVSSILKELSQRTFSPDPVRICDDPDGWNWREFIAQRRSVEITASQS